jgi:hypothetical protein
MRHLLQENREKKNWPWPLGITFLGAGGKDPRLDTLIAATGGTRRLIGFPPFHSAYSIQIEYEDGTLAAGTKGGLVYIVAGTGSQKNGEPIPTRKLAQGAPILSVCWVNKSLLAVSDTERRCFIWPTNQEAPPRPLDTKGETICCLHRLKNGLLAGLSSGGKVLFWELPEGRLVRSIEIPVPPSISALVKMNYWPCADALACPGPTGDLTLLGLEKDNVRSLKAHDGTFYALSLWGEHLLTAGMQDGRMKIWEVGTDRPINDFQTGKAVVSAAALGQAKVLLIEAGGTANIYTVEEEKLKLMSPLPGEDYRMVFVPSPERIKAIKDQQRDEEVRRIVKEIQDGIGHMADNEVEDLHSRLKQLGYEHVSLGLRSKQAIQKENMVEALRYSASLLQILPKNDPKVCSSMKEYAGLLEKTWHFPEADAVRQILEIDPNYRLVVKTENLERIARKLRESPWVIEPDIPIKDIIESAGSIRKRFIGRYVINKLEPVSCRGVQLTVEAIAERYERVRKESRRESFPLATPEQVWWVSRQGHDQVQLISFGHGATDYIQGLQFVVQVLCGSLDTLVVPVVLFDWRDTSPKESIEDGNKRASDALNGIRSNDLSNVYLGAVHKVLKQALQRLVNEKLAERR